MACRYPGFQSVRQVWQGSYHDVLAAPFVWWWTHPPEVVGQTHSLAKRSCECPQEGVGGRLRFYNVSIAGLDVLLHPHIYALI